MDHISDTEISDTESMDKRKTAHAAAVMHTAAAAVTGFLHKNIVLCCAVLGAAVTSFFVPPDREYLDYFDYKTLSCLFTTLAVICALRNIRFFTILARAIVRRAKNARLCVLTLVYITFIGSMLLANDMALLTFLPLGYFALTATNKEKYMAFTFIMQNIAANLGGMLTPFGNPQNLYLYSRFAIPTSEFMGIMLFPFCLSIAAVTALVLIVVRPEPLSVPEEHYPLNKPRAMVYTVLFLLAIASVFRVVPYLISLGIIFVCLLFLDRRALLKVDYALLLTFTAFFIFSGNMARIPAVREILSALLMKNTMLVSALSCQLISNVPTAILLSSFTADYRGLLLGVNIGGVGTLISSLASLITFRQYATVAPEKTKSYLLLFALINFFFLALLLSAESLYLRIFG